jgi:hypothetical protein
MDKIITLLTSLFNLTKVASVTLPGLLAAAGLALVLWPAMPIDLIPVVTAVSTSQNSVVDNLQRSAPLSAEPPSAFPSAFGRACSVEHWALDDVINRMKFEAGQAEHQARAPQSGLPPVDVESSWPSEALRQLLRIERQANNLSVPDSRKRSILEQVVLDFEAHNLDVCIDLEKSWQGQEEKDIQQLTTDVANVETQRGAAQANFLAYQKSNSPLATHYKAEMDTFQHQIDSLRENIRGKNRDVQERIRRVNELNDEKQVISDRLKDPGRLRPRLGFDLFLTGLINHLVGFVLLALAAAVVVTAIDRAWFGLLYEDLFDGF